LDRGTGAWGAALRAAALPRGGTDKRGRHARRQGNLSAGGGPGQGAREARLSGPRCCWLWGYRGTPGVVDTTLIALLEEALDGLGQQQTGLRARALSRLAME